MVFFCCDGCNESFKKARVDAHAAKCRQCYSVSCVDCSQSFPGDEYRNHTSCISEAERYEKTIYRGSRKLDESGTGHRNQQQKVKKMTPQEMWNHTIQIAAEQAPPTLKSYMDQLAMLENVPRKEKQFCNFTVNSLRLKGPRGDKVKGEIWAHLVKVRDEEKKRKEEDENKRKSSKDEVEVSDSSTKSEAKTVSASSDDEPSNKESSADKSPSTDLPTEKVVTKAMKKTLKKAPNKQLKFKALRKQVQESLSIETDKTGKKKWKKLLQQCVDANPSKLVVDGKVVKLST